jgi:hypothetical protein
MNDHSAGCLALEHAKCSSAARSARRIELGSTLTHLRPTWSATVPLTIAPSIAPMVSIEPKREYCIWAC